MIILITGAPGAGKTSLLVSMLMNDESFKNRSIYVDGIPDLKIPHEPIPEEQTINNWNQWLPKTAILVVDEAQRYWRPRSNSSAVPVELQALETHRHHSWDLIFITQHPSLLDHHIRRFVGRHIHIGLTSLGVRKFSEWTSCKNPDSKVDMRDAMKKVYKLPKETFNMYRSASDHIQLTGKRRKILPIVIVLSILFVLAALFAAYKIFHFNDELKSDDKKNQKPDLVSTGDVNQSSNLSNSSSNFLTTPDLKTVGTSPSDYANRIPEKPETKPIYDNVRQVQAFEFPSMCIESKARNECKCYSHQATLIKDIPKEFCKEYIENGIFNPYQARTDSQSQPVSKEG